MFHFLATIYLLLSLIRIVRMWREILHGIKGKSQPGHYKNVVSLVKATVAASYKRSVNNFSIK